MTKLGISLVAALMAVVASVAGQFTNKGALYGTVAWRGSMKPIAGVTITLTQPGADDEGTMFTNAAGSFSAYPLEPGAYVVRAYYSNIRVSCSEPVKVKADDSIGIKFAMPEPTSVAARYTQDCLAQ